MTTPPFIDELERALGSHLSLHAREGAALELEDAVSGRTFQLTPNTDQLIRRAARLTQSGVAAGSLRTGGSIATGIGLLATHIEEAVAMAGPRDTRLTLRPGGIYSE